MPDFRPPRLLVPARPASAPAAPLPHPAARPSAARARAARSRRAWLVVLPVPFAVVVFGLVTLQLWTMSAGQIAPRHRAEALCFLLERPPAFAPPMRVEPSAAMIRGRFARGTPPLAAMQQAMQFGPSNTLRQWVQRLGDFDVEVLWLRIPDRDGDRHWLVVGWMEDADLALCNFRFPGTGSELSGDEIRWGDDLLDRILRPQYFRAGSVPAVRIHPPAHGVLPPLGPESATP